MEIYEMKSLKQPLLYLYSPKQHMMLASCSLNFLTNKTDSRLHHKIQQKQIHLNQINV